MSKKQKYISAFFAAYNVFLAFVAIFNIFNFSAPILRILLALSALQVGIYKIYDCLHANKIHTNNVVVTTAPAPVIKLQAKTKSHEEIFERFFKEIKENLAHELSKQLLEQDCIVFTDFKEPDNFVTVTADIKVIKENDI